MIEKENSPTGRGSDVWILLENIKSSRGIKSAKTLKKQNLKEKKSTKRTKKAKLMIKKLTDRQGEWDMDYLKEDKEFYENKSAKTSKKRNLRAKNIQKTSKNLD